MDNDAVINDLKQFITTTVGQQIQESEERLSAKFDKLAESVAEAIVNSNDSVDETLRYHETRLTHLEKLPLN